MEESKTTSEGKFCNPTCSFSFMWNVLFLLLSTRLCRSYLEDSCEFVNFPSCQTPTIKHCMIQFIYYYSPCGSGCSQGGEEEEGDHLGRRFQRHQAAAQAEITQPRRGFISSFVSLFHLCYVCREYVAFGFHSPNFMLFLCDFSLGPGYFGVQGTAVEGPAKLVPSSGNNKVYYSCCYVSFVDVDVCMFKKMYAWLAALYYIVALHSVYVHCNFIWFFLQFEAEHVSLEALEDKKKLVELVI